MKTLEKVSDFVGKYMAAIVIVVAALALFFPGTFSAALLWANSEEKIVFILGFRKICGFSGSPFSQGGAVTERGAASARPAI